MQKQEIKKILFPTDFSVASDYALSYAVFMAKQFKVEIFPKDMLLKGMK